MEQNLQSQEKKTLLIKEEVWKWMREHRERNKNLSDK